MKNYYMFFDENTMPLAVFLTENKTKAIKLMEKLYSKKWRQLVIENKITVKKEMDVPKEKWDEIFKKHEKKEKEKKKIKSLSKIRHLLKDSAYHEELLETPTKTIHLETSKYYSGK